MKPQAMAISEMRKTRECINCRTRETPLWRKSNDGSSLCNACGLYWRNHGISRPAHDIAEYTSQIAINSKYANDLKIEKMVAESLVLLKYDHSKVGSHRSSKCLQFKKHENNSTAHTRPSLQNTKGRPRSAVNTLPSKSQTYKNNYYYMQDYKDPNRYTTPSPKKRLAKPENNDIIDSPDFDKAVDTLVHIQD